MNNATMRYPEWIDVQKVKLDHCDGISVCVIDTENPDLIAWVTDPNGDINDPGDVWVVVEEAKRQLQEIILPVNIEEAIFFPDKAHAPFLHRWNSPWPTEE